MTEGRYVQANFSTKRWRAAIPKNKYPYAFIPQSIKNSARYEAILWCEDQFGKESSAVSRWLYYDDGFFFVHEIDAAAFRLRWC